MSLSRGTRLGPYEILDLVGTGGMGEVYRARDTRLDRTVAIKTIRTAVASDLDFRRRFEREARAISALNHPHICTLHDIGHYDDVDFMVMEYVRGETLSSLLRRDHLPLDQAIRYAAQIADALDKAHRQGIVHRDLKPTNIMIVGSGVKLLDFGVAKLCAPQEPLAGGLAATVTARGDVTSAGAVVGTLQFVSPEQLQGKEADHRADIFAFGAVVYEMVTSRRAFDGSTTAAVIGAILHSEPPPLCAVRPTAPAALEHLVNVCLAKDPEARWSSAHDLALLLAGIKSRDASSSASSRPLAARQTWIAWGIAVVCLVVAATMGIRSALQPVANVPMFQVSIPPPVGATLDFGEAPQISPDGARVAFVAIDSSGRSALYVRELDATVPHLLADTDGATQPFWSPDSQSVGFFAGARLKTISISGNGPRTLASAPVPRGGTWNHDGVILFVPRAPDGVHRVSSNGGDVTPLDMAGPIPCWFPSYLPDGRHFLCTVLQSSRRIEALYVASLDSSDMKLVMPAHGAGAVMASDHLLYRGGEGELVAQPFDVGTLSLAGTPVAVASNVAFNPVGYRTLFSASNEGTLSYLASSGGSRLTWVDRVGKEVGVVGPRAYYNSLSMSNDEQRLFVDQADPHSRDVDVWMFDDLGGPPSRLTFSPTSDFYPVSSPDGRQVVFGSLRGGAPNMYLQQTNAPGSESLLLKWPGPSAPTDWSSDGRFIVFRSLDPKTGWDVWVLPLLGDRKAFPFAASEYDERMGRLSPDRRWMAYGSDQGGTFEVYVQTFPRPGAKWQVSRGGGYQPAWRQDGKELFYLAADKTLMAVSVSVGEQDLKFGAPQALFGTRATAWEMLGNQYVVAANGERFLVNRQREDAAGTPVQIIQNWTRRVQTR